MKISSAPEPVLRPAAAPSAAAPAVSKADKVKVDKTPAPGLPPETPALLEGLGVAAVLATQAQRRTEEPAEIAELGGQTTPSTVSAASDNSDKARSLSREAVTRAAGQRNAESKAATGTDPKTSPGDGPPPAPRSDPFEREPETAARTRPAPGFQSYQTTLSDRDAGSGSRLDSRF